MIYFKTKKVQRTPLEKLGEFSLIKHLNQCINVTHYSTVKSIWYDSSVIRFADKQVVVSTDILLESIHFNLSYTSLTHLG
ncbi:MAG: hypothetical protein ACMUEM_07455 [Flavobacteriales bacterium AspAUS03]